MTERRIVLLRHTKAERPAAVRDFDRPLAARGHADAAAAGAWLVHTGYLPEVVICSPAKRTRQTWHGVAMGMAVEPPGPTTSAAASAPGDQSPLVRYEDSAYDGRAGDLLALVQAAPQEARTILVIAHNPGISELSGLLDPVHADPEGLRTGGIAVHRLTGQWSATGADSAPLIAWHTARG